MCVPICKYIFTACLGGEKKSLLYWAGWSWCGLNFSKLRFSFSTHWCVEWSFSWTSGTLPIARLEWQLCFGDLCILKESCRTAKRCFPILQGEHMGSGVLIFKQRSCGVCSRGSLALLCESAFCWSCEMLCTLQGTGGVPPPSHSCLVAGLDIYILTFLLNTSKPYVLIQFYELILFNMFPRLNASAVLTWQCLQLFSTSFFSPTNGAACPWKTKNYIFFLSSDPAREQFYRVKKPQATGSRKLQSLCQCFLF